MTGSPAAAPAVQFEGVRKSYGGEDVVRSLDLHVAEGEFLTLLGPSGSGKTTTLMMLAGFEQPTAGRILLDGRDIAALPPHRRGLGVVFQSYALFPHMTVAENVAFPLSVRGVGRAERDSRVATALDMVRLPGLGGRKPAQLSGGQQQRVALARALVFQPRVVLMDEPLGALDKQLREELQLEIRGIHQRLGVTMVYVTHDQAEALTLSDRIAVFHAGVVQQLDAPRTLYEQPANAFVAGFLGENNRLPGRILATEDGIATLQLACGPTVYAQTAAPPGPAVLMVRPERIAAAGVDADAMGDGAIPARLEEAIYGGDHHRLRFSVGQGGQVTVKRPAAAGMAGLRVGSVAALAWEPEHATAFAE